MTILIAASKTAFTFCNGIGSKFISGRIFVKTSNYLSAKMMKNILHTKIERHQ